jgi:hypothetical protein
VGQPADFGENETAEGWSVAFAVEGTRVDLAFASVGPAATFTGPGGVESSEQPCAVRGHVGDTEIEGRGQRGEGRGDPDWSQMQSVRAVSAWLDDGRSFVASAIRADGAKGHDADQITAFFLDPEAEAEVAPLNEARISTAYDADGRQRRAGLELYETEETQVPRRGAGTLLCGTTLDLGELRLDSAFFSWGLAGQDGIGRYDLLRRVGA